MQRFPIRPSHIFFSLYKNRSLVWASIKHEILGRYKGSMVGVFWSLLIPLFMLSVYTLVFGEIFKARWNHNSSSTSEFALVLFAGLIIFNIFSECLSRAPTLILSHPNYVKKVIYPLEILPWVALGTAMFHGTVSFFAWVIGYIVLIGTPPATILYLPVIIVPFSLLIMGISWGLASLGVFIRDVSQFLGLALTAMMFLSPIFYPATAVSESYRFLIYLNPLTPIIEQARDVMYWGKTPNLAVLGIYWIAAAITSWLGFIWFQKTRKGFADVI